MEYKNLLIERGDDLVAGITLNRPDELNTFNTPMARELHHALWELDSDPSVRVIVIKGAGKAFSAGIDVNELFDKTVQDYKDWIGLMERPLVTIGEIGKPVIAQVHGVAAANGAGLVAAADLAVAADNARMGLTAINVGLSCLGPVLPVMRLVGRKRALELLLGGELIKANDALAMGLVNRVAPADELEAVTREWAARLALKSPIAVQLSKKAFYTAEDQGYHKAFEYMNEAFARLCMSEDAKEGVSAFLERRDPVWKER